MEERKLIAPLNDGESSGGRIPMSLVMVLSRPQMMPFQNAEGPPRTVGLLLYTSKVIVMIKTELGSLGLRQENGFVLRNF